jgi:hypothetical protein
LNVVAAAVMAAADFQDPLLPEIIMAVAILPVDLFEEDTDNINSIKTYFAVPSANPGGLFCSYRKKKSLDWV